MFILRTLIEKYACNKSKLFACFVDFEKAFDSVLHSALLLKLAKLDIKGPFYDIIRSMYRENDLHVRIHDTLTGTFAPKLGVRLGDNLSPNLFKIFINDLPNIFSERDDQAELDGIRISSLLYYENNCLSVNLKKTKVVVVCQNGRLSTDRFYY